MDIDAYNHDKKVCCQKRTEGGGNAMPGKQFKKYDRKFWTDDVLLYLDGVSFVHKRNPYRDALTPRWGIWRRSNEGLKHTTKGSKSLMFGSLTALSLQKNIKNSMQNGLQDLITKLYILH